MRFELNEDQVTRLKVWQEAIKLVHGAYGRYEYLFSPNEIGTTVTVYSYLANAELDLSDVENW